MNPERYLRNGLLLLVLGAFVFGLFVSTTWSFFVWRWNAWTPEIRKEIGVGDEAPDFTLFDLNGQLFHLAEEAAKQPIVLQIGSFT